MIVEISHSGASNVLVNNSPLPIKVEVQLFRDGKDGKDGIDGTILQDVDYLAQYLISKL